MDNGCFLQVGVGYMDVYESINKGLQEAISYESGNGAARTVKCTDIPCTRLSCKAIYNIRPLDYGRKCGNGCIYVI